MVAKRLSVDRTKAWGTGSWVTELMTVPRRWVGWSAERPDGDCAERGARRKNNAPRRSASGEDARAWAWACIANRGMADYDMFYMWRGNNAMEMDAVAEGLR